MKTAVSIGAVIASAALVVPSAGAVAPTPSSESASVGNATAGAPSGAGGSTGVAARAGYATLDMSVPKKIVPFRPFRVTVTTSSPGSLAITARHKRGSNLLKTISVGPGTHRVTTATRWLKTRAIRATLTTPDGGTVSVTARTRTAKRAYPRISRVTKKDLGSSWKPGCPGRPENLRALDINHVNYRGRVKRGRIIVDYRIVSNVRRALAKALKKGFRIRRMVPVQRYGSSDDRSMRADNTSGYNCRRFPSSGRWDRHAYGFAIDINPRRNPQVFSYKLLPSNGKKFVKRQPLRRGMIGHRSVVRRVLVRRGWTWGAQYRNPDYQHFEIPGR